MKDCNEAYEKISREINSNCRLILTGADFDRLYRYALAAHKRAKHNINGKGSDDEREKLESIETTRYDEFTKNFNNPFRLDMEGPADEMVLFIFYDYTYSYYVRKCKDGWYVDFYKSFYNSKDNNDVPMKIGYMYNPKDNEYYPTSEDEAIRVIYEKPFTLKFQKTE